MECQGFVNQYKLIEVIGAGGWSKVVKAYDTKLHKHVAIKIISKKHIKLLKAESTVTNEIAIMKKLDHPNIVKLLEFMEDVKNIYIVMELYESKNLFHFVVDACHIPEIVIKNIMKQITSAVRYLHDQGIVHGDLKLENILFNPYNGEVKIIDFGYSRFAKNGELYDTRYCSISYASPEILKNEKVDLFKADNWALGVIYYSLCFRKQPFYSEEEKEEIENIIKCEYEVPQIASNQQKQIILSTLCNNPAKRACTTKLYSIFHEQTGPIPKITRKITAPMRNTISSGCLSHVNAAGPSKLPKLY